MDELFRSHTKRDYIYNASDSHTSDMIQLAKDAAASFGYKLLQGCYAFWPLPQFETPAEIQLLKVLDVPVTGASTIPE